MDSLETEHGCFGSTSSVISILHLPFLAAQAFNFTDRFIPRIIFQITFLFDISLHCIPARRNNWADTSFNEFVPAIFRVIGAVQTSIVDLRLYLIQQRRQLRSIIAGTIGQGEAVDKARLGITSQMEFAPGPPLAIAMLMHFTFTFTVYFQSGGVDNGIDRSAGRDVESLYIQCLGTALDLRVAGNFQFQSHRFQ